MLLQLCINNHSAIKSFPLTMEFFILVFICIYLFDTGYLTFIRFAHTHTNIHSFQSIISRFSFKNLRCFYLLSLFQMEAEQRKGATTFGFFLFRVRFNQKHITAHIKLKLPFSVCDSVATNTFHNSDVTQYLSEKKKRKKREAISSCILTYRVNSTFALQN